MDYAVSGQVLRFENLHWCAIFEADGAVIDNGQWAETAVSTPDDLLTQGTGPFYCLEVL